VDKKKSAAIAAVLYYLKDEYERQQLLKGTPFSAVNLWNLFGRNTTAQLRRLIQSRNFSRHSSSVLARSVCHIRKGFSKQKVKYCAMNFCTRIGFAGRNRMASHICSIGIQKTT
jgi:hypothetical protein